jgi:hypothetical protein
MNTITDTQYRHAARRIYTKDTDDVKIDDTAPISKGSANGAYVQAWVWVGNDLFDERETNP